MEIDPAWSEIAWRLALTVGAGLLIGYNRSERGKAAGLCTTLLVCVAASVAMIQVNVLFSTQGSPPNSFVHFDVMRLPLGILTGVGFIGAGAIIRRDNGIVGVTTAATLWLVTVIGLCLGGGQIILGLVATALGVFAIWGVKAIERRLPLEHPASLTLTLEVDGPRPMSIRRLVDAADDLRIVAVKETLDRSTASRRLDFKMKRLRAHRDLRPPALIGELEHLEGVRGLAWTE